MKTSKVEAWVWVLVYGGALLACLGLFTARTDALLGWLIGLTGVALLAGGVVLLYLRSRMGP